MSSVLRKIIFNSYKSCVTQSRRTFFRVPKSYQKSLDKRPYLVQGIQAGILMGAGDLCAQTWFSASETVKIDYIRTFKFCSIGFAFVGPCIRLWYGTLDRAIKIKSPVARAMTKVGIDQLVFAPIFTAILVSTISYTQDQNIQSIKDKLRTQYVDIILCNYYVWPWVQIVNFRFVPLNYQVLLTQAVAFLWNIYVSWKTHSTDHKNVSAVSA